MEKLFFTGATGFLGRIVKPILDKRYDVTTCGMSSDNMVKANLALEEPRIPCRFDIVLHASGKAHVVPKTEKEKKEFYDVNYKGTINLCTSLERVGVPRSIIFISTVAVYGCEKGDNIDERFPLNGTTPYAKSKIKAEEYLAKWCEEHNVILSILRPALIAGPNPPGNLKSMINGIKTGKYFSVAGGKSRKSIVMAQDIANLVPLTERKGGIYNICDDYHPMFRELEVLVSSQLGKINPISIPYWLAKAFALVGDCTGGLFPLDSKKLDKITTSLTFSNDKAKRDLGWCPLSVIDNFKI